MLTTAAWAAGRERVLHTFGNYAKNPGTTPILDPAGNLFGTTQYGGVSNSGTVWQISPAPAGTFSVLYAFKGDVDGFTPSSLVLDDAGNLYGTTAGGGKFGDGTAFELSPMNGAWLKSTLYTFGGYVGDGNGPEAGLAVDSAGNLYGTTASGGQFGFGTVFELMPTSGGGWTESVIYSFFGNGVDGKEPLAPVTLDEGGNLFGTTYDGGESGYGIVFELSPAAGIWQESVVYTFQGGADGSFPQARVTFDSSGNLFGTTELGGSSDSGTVFKLTPSGGTWTESVIHYFQPSAGDGSNPFAGVVFDAAGNLYGTTAYGGGSYGGGTVFRMSIGSSGNWMETGQHSFTGSGDGSTPRAGVILNGSAEIYGTTYGGGSAGNGLVFEVTF